MKWKDHLKIETYKMFIVYIRTIVENKFQCL